ncbi:hypothetical protein SO802_028574 [Lithocarpus litseifolius]|uniref:Reverse transcriptase zinc-binding domain-containing protein n=1 Tax=Lithocarpus litseifolius TaxID=425828 RepID=A0AAW2BW42_9ROSI
MSSSNENSLSSSRIWKAMKKGMDVFKRGTRWSLGRDSNLRFWYDSWTSNGPLRSIIYGPLTREEEEIKVKDLASIDGWNWGKLSLILPPKIFLEIQAMPRSHFANEEDRIISNATANGNFNLSSAYILANGEAPQFFDGKWIWKLKVLPRIQSFIWMCFHNSIATRERLASRGLQVDTVCPMCNLHPETIIHLLRDCHVAASCWQSLGMGVLSFDFFSLDLRSWLANNCKTTSASNHLQISWIVIFAVGIWALWSHRNRVVFKNMPSSQAIHRDIIHRAVEYALVAQSTITKQPRIARNIRWERPNRGWYKLNTDGSSLGNPGMASGGGILRSESGTWVKDFTRKIGIATSFVAECGLLGMGSTCV